MTEVRRIVTDSMFGLQLPDIDVWSNRVGVVLGQNPGPFSGPGTNTYVVGTGRRPLLIDTGQGVPSYLPLLVQGLRDIRGADEIEALVVTHAHIDHIGGAPQIRERFGDVPVLKKAWPGKDEAFSVPIRAIDDGEVMRTEGATLRAIWTPGHASDHLCYYLEEERALFTGDLVLGAGTTVIPDEGGDLADYLASLRRLLTLDLAVIYPGHGPAIRRPHEKLGEYVAHRELRERQILEALRAGCTTVPEIVARIYTDVPDILHLAAGSSVRAHLRKLRREAVVWRDGDRWRLAS